MFDVLSSTKTVLNRITFPENQRCGKHKKKVKVKMEKDALMCQSKEA